MAAIAFISALPGPALFVALVQLLPAPIAPLNSWLKKKGGSLVFLSSD
jgi:hypothetical protein